jgi:phosphoglycolate phosphatase
MVATLQTVIWDFNGTILSDVELSVEGLNLLRSRRAMSAVTVEEYRDLFGFPVQDYYAGLGFDFTADPFSDLSREYHDHFFANMHNCRPHRHIPELMREIRERGVRQFVLSAMQEPELRRVLSLLGLAECVEEIYGLGDLLARGKVERGHQLMRDWDVVPDETVLIGDTDHDVDVARELGVTPITLTIGHQAPHRFDHFDHPRVDSVQELRTLLL